MVQYGTLVQAHFEGGYTRTSYPWPDSIVLCEMSSVKSSAEVNLELLTPEPKFQELEFEVWDSELGILMIQTSLILLLASVQGPLYPTV